MTGSLAAIAKLPAWCRCASDAEQGAPVLVRPPVQKSVRQSTRDVNLRELKDFAGWKSERLGVQVYLQPWEDAQRLVLQSSHSGRGTHGLAAFRPASRGKMSGEWHSDLAHGTQRPGTQSRAESVTLSRH